MLEGAVGELIAALDLLDRVKDPKELLHAAALCVQLREGRPGEPGLAAQISRQAHGPHPETVGLQIKHL